MINDDHVDGVHNENVNVNDDTFLDYIGDGGWESLPKDKVTPTVKKRALKLPAYLKSPFL